MTDILIVEDNKELAELLCDFLRTENYTVSIAQSGEKALSLYEKYGARLIVLDIMLPGIDGFYVCKKIREESNTPILIVSAKTEKEDKLNGLLLGADDYIEKPYDNELVAVEVKTRKFGSMTYGADAVTWSKKRKIALTLLEYAAENGLEASIMRFDIAELTITTEEHPRVLEMNYYKDAFDGTGLKLY